jgi:hypothetical protein
MAIAALYTYSSLPSPSKTFLSPIFSIVSALIGQTSQGTWLGWTVVSCQVWHSSRTIVSRERDHVETEGDGAEVETVGKGSDLCEGTGEGAKGCSTENGQGAEEKDGENEGVGRGSFYLLPTRPSSYTPLGIRRSVVSMNQPQQRKEEPMRQGLHPSCLWYIPPVRVAPQLSHRCCRWITLVSWL